MLPPKLISIPAGTFLMGSDSGQDVERPVHRVHVDAFSLAETQVTVAEYAEFLADAKAPPPGRHCPAEQSPARSFRSRSRPLPSG